MVELIAKCLFCVRTPLVQAMDNVYRVGANALMALGAISVPINWVPVLKIVEEMASATKGQRCVSVVKGGLALYAK